MSTSFFGEKAVVPNDMMLDIALLESKLLWDDLDSRISNDYSDVNKEWKFYSKKAGWSLIFKQKNRTLLYFVPLAGYFKVWFVFGDNAINTAKQAALPKHVHEAICTATPYVEGTLFDVEVKEAKDLDTVRMLLEIKVKV